MVVPASDVGVRESQRLTAAFVPVINTASPSPAAAAPDRPADACSDDLARDVVLLRTG